jgi:asparagine synthase (glutamine-hydrolysing)
MCGIAGLVLAPGESNASALETVQRMTDHMRTRGPDAEGVWASEGVTLGHRRLAILDLDARANQPMVSNDRRYAIVFNGEIYNFRELRRALEADGVAFRTTSDTEVLLALFARDGERMLPRLRGMFALAIWDTYSRQLFMARDPYGIKPLYYTRTKDGFLFASEVKALLASGLVGGETESAGLVGFYLWGSVPEPWTLFRNVLALPAGHWLRVLRGVPEAPVCWHDIRTHWQRNAEKESASDRKDRVREAVKDSVRAHLVADVSVSVFLSGGIDSGAIAGLAAELGAQVEGISIGFEEFDGKQDDEIPVAHMIASQYGMPHHVRMVSRAEFEQDLPRIFAAMDQPSVDGVNTWFASKAAAELGYKVALSGVGGDELFCGYSSFRQIPRTAALGRVIAAIPSTRALLSAPCAYFAKNRSKPKLAALPTFMNSVEGAYFLSRGLFMPDELPELMGPEMACEGLASLGGSPAGMTQAGARDGACAVGLLESTLYLRNQLLRDSDWASMGHSLELRTPLVDAVLLQKLGPFVSDFAGGSGKAMLARSPKKSLPDRVISRPKTGFGLPMEKWFSAMTDHRAGTDLPLVTAPGTPWARRWAVTIMGRGYGRRV